MYLQCVKNQVLNVCFSLKDFCNPALILGSITAIVPSKFITNDRVVIELDNLILWRGKPKLIRVDNGPKVNANKLALWCESNGIQLKHIQPGKPAQNGYIERFN